MLGAVGLHERWKASHARDELFDRYMRRWARGLMWINRVRFEVHGVLPPSSGPRLVVSNHRSALDIPLLLTHFGGSVLSRSDIADWPLLGRAARKARTIFVDRESVRSGVQAIRGIREQLKSGRTVTIFPEGTTLPGDRVGSFSGGAFSAIRGLDVELLPVGLAYTEGTEYVEDSFLEHASAIASRSSTRVVAVVGEPRRVQGKADEVARLLQESVQGLVGEAREKM